MAFFRLAAVHQEGKVVPKDSGLAYAYLKLATLTEQRVNEKTQATLDKFKAALSADELQQAEKMIVGEKSNPSALTAKARQGIADAERLVKSGRK